MQVQVQVVQKKDFKVYTCTCMYVSCASVSMHDKFSRLCL